MKNNNVAAILVLATLPTLALATTLPLDGALKKSGLQIVGESKYPFSKGKIHFKTSSGLSCSGKYMNKDLDDLNEGDVSCSDGRTGTFTLHSKNPHIKGWATGTLSDGEEFVFSIGESIEHGKYAPFLAPGQVYQYVGDTTVDGVIVDPAGIPPEKYAADVAACRKFREQAGGSLLGDAIGGAVAGAAVASLAGDEYSRTEAAHYGAKVSAAEGIGDSADEQDRVLRRCLSGRGYRVLN